jgi:hypothetical protein
VAVAASGKFDPAISTFNIGLPMAPVRGQPRPESNL